VRNGANEQPGAGEPKPELGGNMKKTAIAALTVMIAIAASTAAFAQRRPTYEQCFQLGLARGFLPTVGDWRNFELFIRQCMAGRVPF
jgi:hypothetical protein